MNREESERYILGALLLWPENLSEVNLFSEHFRHPIHRAIFEAILATDAAGEAVDAITVRDRLKGQASHEVLTLSREAGGASNIRHHADRLREQYRLDQAKDIAEGLTVAANKGDRGGIDEAITALMALNASQRKHEYTLREALSAARDHMDAVMHGEVEPGLMTGLTGLDRVLGGLHRQDLIVLGGRPGMGKTAMLLRVLLGADVACGLVSGEQGFQQIGERNIAIEGRVALAKMRNGDLGDIEWPRISNAFMELMDRRYLIYDKPAPTLQDIRNTARAWKHHHDIQLLGVDYLQRMKGDPRMAKTERVGENVAGLKELARELDIPVIALSSVNRAVDTRADKRPNMGDLYWAGDIENEADQVMLLYRDEVYHDDTPNAGKAEILIEKNRHGPTGVVGVAWLQEFVRFDNLDTRYTEEAA